MKSSKFIVLVCYALISHGCQQKEVEEYPLDSIFDKIEFTDSTTINMCKYIQSDWDSILIVKPYTVVSKQVILNELTNFSSVKSKIEDIEFTDAISYLLFVKNKKVIGYGSVKRSPIDFATFTSEGKSMASIKRSDCDMLFLKKGSKKLSIMQ